MAIVKKYRAKVVSIINPVDGIYTLEFESLDGPFKYSPGQFLHLAIDQDYDGTGQWPESRCFSMQSSPDDKTIKITYAVKGTFTKEMETQLKVGYLAWLKLPYGDLFTHPHNKSNTVFIAGGTGITPYLSLFTHDSFNKYINPRIYLGFRTKGHNIYENQLERMQQIRVIQNNSCNSCISVKSYYENKDGILDIKEIIDENSSSSSYFISGPPTMIKVFKNALTENGVSTSNIHKDDWE